MPPSFCDVVSELCALALALTHAPTHSPTLTHPLTHSFTSLPPSLTPSQAGIRAINSDNKNTEMSETDKFVEMMMGFVGAETPVRGTVLREAISELEGDKSGHPLSDVMAFVCSYVLVINCTYTHVHAL